MELRSGATVQKRGSPATDHNDNSTNGHVKGADAGAGGEGRVLGVMFLGLLLDLLAFTMILPLLPALLDHYGHTDQGGLYSVLQQGVQGFRELVGAPDTPRWNSVLFGGLIGSMFSLLQFLASPLMGAASDVYGRRPVMLISMVGIAASYALWAVAHSFSLFVLARVVGGISKGNVSLSTAIVTDVAPPSRRGKGMALVGIAFSVGFILGPLIGAGFSMQARSQGPGQLYTAPALFALFLALLDLTFLYFCLQETLPTEKRAKSLGSGVKAAWSLINPASLFKFEAVTGMSNKDVDSVQGVGLVYFLYLFFYSGLEFTLTFLTHNRFHFDSLQQGKMFFVIGLAMVIVQGGCVRRLKPGRELAMSKKAILALIPAFLLIGFAYSQAVLYCGLLLFAFASAVVVPCLTTEVSSYGSVEQKGTVMGIFRSLGALARALGPIVASTVYWSAGPVVCYVAGALCLLLPLLLLIRIQSTPSTHPTKTQ